MIKIFYGKLKRLKINLFNPIIFLCYLLLLGCSEKKRPNNQQYLEELRSKATSSAIQGDFTSADSIGRVLYNEALKANDDVYMAYGLLCQSYYNYKNEDSKKRISLVKKALNIAQTTNNDTLISRVYNILGSYATLSDYDFASAIHYFTEAKNYAERIGAKDFVMAAECNISEIYHSVGDTLGLTYDIDIYEFAKVTGQYGLLLPATQHVAEHYMKNPRTANQALNYIQDIDSVKSAYLYNKLLGDYYKVTGNYNEARERYLKAIEEKTESAGVFLSYADLLNRQKRYNESIEQLTFGEKYLKNSSAYNVARTQLYKLYADNFQALGNDNAALNYFEKYLAISDSINEFRNQEQVNRFRIKYELGKKELEIQKSHNELKTRNIIIISIISFSLIFIILQWLYLKKRNKLYSVIVENQKNLNSLKHGFRYEVLKLNPQEEENLENEGNLEIEEKNEGNNGGLSEVKSKEIWLKIQNEIENNHIYRDPNISRDLFAAKIGCNHTWFSQVIKDKTGLSYPQFMNKHRIDEALDVLADPTYSISHEELWRSLGFLSKATFYSSFKNKMGMSPSEYRKRVISEK